ncbi:MAG: hypothetical protein AMXMBFR33_16260 [Candidatus Xenobia bacterium]
MTASAPSQADEGMWLYSDPPVKILKERYGFEPGSAWLEHLQKSSVRFNSGGSGSFVSSRGLVMTNHHVGAEQIAKLSSPGKDLLDTGYLATSQAQELKCPDLELNVLMTVEDVTGRVQGSVKSGMDAAAAEKARRAEMNTIEKESTDKTGLRSDVVTLYQGGRYHLYRYKKYTDVRLVFAPEQDIAFFGGDTDNFEFPRYDLDVTFFRAYENGQPARIEHFLKWSPTGPRDGELVFVSGHPGNTQRLNTMADLAFQRDRRLPLVLNLLRRLEVLYATYGERTQENKRQSKDDLFGVQNSRKALLGRLGGLQDPAFMAAKQKLEDELRQAVAGSPEWSAAFTQVEQAIRLYGQILDDLYLYERHYAFNSRLFELAQSLARYRTEVSKPNTDRLREYRDSNLESLQQELFSPAPIYPEFERVKLADSLAMLLELRGPEDPLVRRILAGKSPRERAVELVNGTRLLDVAERKRLAETGAADSKDPMIDLALLVDPTARKVRKAYDEQVSEPLRQAYSAIAQARFAKYGTELAPDATFTLRLSFGVVKGYREDGRAVPAFTDFAGLYRRSAEHGNEVPFRLPRRWVERKSRLDLSTPFNFVSTADIIGGNSGSPTVNREGQVVGLIFDGNIQSLVLDYAYSEVQARATSVDSRAITEALRKVYDAAALADELGQ